MTHRHRALLGALATVTTATLLASSPLAAHAADTDLHLVLQRTTLTIPYGGTAPDERVLIAADDTVDTGTAPRVSVELVSSSGAVTPLVSGLVLSDEDLDYLDEFPNADYYDHAARYTVPTHGLAAGTYTVRATEVTTDDTAGATTSEDLTVANGVRPAVRSVAVKRSVATVFPVHDGYRDSVTFTIGGSTTTGRAIATTGAAVLKRGTHIVQRWRLSSSSARVTWNGRDHGTVVAGHYRLTVSQRGLTGSTHSASTTVTVDKRSLHSRSSTAHYSATTVLSSHFYDYSISSYGECNRNQYELFGDRVSGAVFCDAYSAHYDTYSIKVPGSLAIPAAVRRSTVRTRPSVTVHQQSKVEDGHAYMHLSAGNDTSTGRVYSGSTSHSLRWSGNPSRLGISFWLGEYTDAGVRSYTVTWHYKTLS
jgi:hypothetical protein